MSTQITTIRKSNPVKVRRALKANLQTRRETGLAPHPDVVRTNRWMVAFVVVILAFAAWMATSVINAKVENAYLVGKQETQTEVIEDLRKDRDRRTDNDASQDKQSVGGLLEAIVTGLLSIIATVVGGLADAFSSHQGRQA